ncbi:MAG: NAD(P)/FAD-dependent oxidoreductase [Acidimicrobiales bacterium]
MRQPRTVGDHAVVLGASIAGLCATRVASERFRSVTIVERDDLPEEGEPRRAVPQGRHLHLLLPAGAQLLERWFPGILAELHAAGATEVDLCRDFLWYQSGGSQRRPESRLRAPAMSRPLLERLIRRRVEAIANVTIRTRTSAEGLTADEGRTRITGVRLGDGRALAGDLVVDATGRAARSLGWIEELGYDGLETSQVHIDTRYVTSVLRRADIPARDWKAAACIGAPSTKRLAILLPIEDDRWILTIAGVHGEAAPTDPARMLDYVRGFESPAIAQVLGTAERLGDAVTHRFAASQRRHVERLRRFPCGWVLLGDSVCSFNPIYGQGMTSAAQQAAALGRTLDRAGRVDRRFARAYFRAASRIVASPWSIAVGGDFTYPGTTGKKPPGTDAVNRYMERVTRAGRHDDQVVIRVNEVISLLRGPQVLLTPAFALRVLRAARRRPPDAAPTHPAGAAAATGVRPGEGSRV